MANAKINLEQIINDCLSAIEREREREIVTRRFGLTKKKETLEQIGELLGITRERVRQLEKAAVIKLKAAASAGQLPGLNNFTARATETLETSGNLANLANLTGALTGTNDEINRSRVAFLAKLSSQLVSFDENDHFHHTIGIAKAHDENAIQNASASIVETIKNLGKPATIEVITEAARHSNPVHVGSLASISKQLAHLNKQWGLVKWPLVNPRNIRDKIYLVLKETGKHMHFSEIAGAIETAEFKKKNVTTQAIHNELIKDKRFVLVGRGRYALKEWGFKSGTVADVIAEVLVKAGPLHRDEIVKKVLEKRFVKDTTILLNLQAKPQFKRVAKATYALAE